jgi:hypothetical protein
MSSGFSCSELNAWLSQLSISSDKSLCFCFCRDYSWEELILADSATSISTKLALMLLA